MEKNSQRREGHQAEEEACRVLHRHGYDIVTRNWRTRRGEIDIIAREGPVLVFVEVKSRAGGEFGGPAEAVDPTKQRRMIAAAREFLGTTGCDLPARFDVVTFLDGKARLLRDAFQVDDGCSPGC